MRWADERYVRVYTRDTGEWLALGWEAQALFIFALRKADRAGIVQTGKAGARGLAGMTGVPLEVVERVLPLLLEDGCLRECDGGYIVPNFIAAQEAMQRRFRIRARPEAMRWAALHPGVPLPPTEPVPDGVEIDEVRIRLLTPTEREAKRLEHEALSAQYRAEAEVRRRERARRWVYFIQAETGGPIKIGISRDVERRRAELQRQERQPLRVLAFMEGTIKDEAAMHQRFATHRLHGEWFSPAPEVLSCIAALNGRKE
jgi:hypothetical protein